MNKNKHRYTQRQHQRYFPILQSYINKIKSTTNLNKIYNTLAMQQMYNTLLARAQKQFKSIKNQILFINVLKSRIPHEVFISQLNANENKIQEALKAEGVVLGDGYEAIKKKMKSKNFNMLTLVQKMENQFNSYYSQSWSDPQVIDEADQAKMPKTKKVSKAKKNIVKKEKKVKSRNQVKQSSYVEDSFYQAVVGDSGLIFEESDQRQSFII